MSCKMNKANTDFNKTKKKKKNKIKDSVLEQSQEKYSKNNKREIAEFFDYGPMEKIKKQNSKSKETECNMVDNAHLVPKSENVKRKLKNKVVLTRNSKQNLEETKSMKGESSKKKKIKKEDAPNNFTSNFNNDISTTTLFQADGINQKTSLLKPSYLQGSKVFETHPASTISPNNITMKGESPKKKKRKREDAPTNFASNFNNDTSTTTPSQTDGINQKTSLLKPSYLQGKEFETHAASTKIDESKTVEAKKAFTFNFNNNDRSRPTSFTVIEKVQKNHSNHISSNQNLLKPPYLQNRDLFQKNSYQNSSKKEKWFKKAEQKNRYVEQQDEEVKLSEGRNYTVSIAVPASILEETCLLHELRTYVVGQLARSACIYSVDEIIVYNDQCWRSSSNMEENIQDYIGMMKMILEYQECPQYLRKNFFPRHRYMSKAGVLNALNPPHHFLAHQWCIYRDGVVLNKDHGKISYVHVGLHNEVEIDRKLEPGLRVTVKFPPEARSMKRLYATVVSPEEPRKQGGLYWGYTVRVANSFSEIFKSDRFEEGYDLTIGTSDTGDSISSTDLPSYKHSLIVFGGVDGLEAALRADKTIAEKEPRKLFQFYLNSCPNQQSRTIRTEEAVLITLSSLSEKLQKCGSNIP